VWLETNGPQGLESLLRTVIHCHAAPLLIVDDDRKCRAASSSAGALLATPAGKLAGGSLDRFVQPGSLPQFHAHWRKLCLEGEQTGALALLTGGGTPLTVEYEAKGNVLPGRHALFLRGQTKEPGGQDFGAFLLDSQGRIACWYSGATRVYGYRAEEAVGQPESILYPPDGSPDGASEKRLAKSAREEHSGDEEWQVAKDGSRFWANTITLALKDHEGNLRGFARVVRDFSERHRSEILRQSRVPSRGLPARAAITGVVSGELEQIYDVNEAFLEIAGYSREDLSAGRLAWADLTPPEYLAIDELAHEEALRFGACTPYERELIRKDGGRVRVLVTTAVLKVAPFRWISFVRDLRERDQLEDVGQDQGDGQVFEEMVGESAALRRVRTQVEIVAPTDATVLILGETGTGKELVARAIHRLSGRANFPFISLNCAAIPTGLLESELFGYERGAFTGALHQKIGRFEMANRGTLFLDEVGDIPLELQPKLLRALQEKAFERLGATKTTPIDVRLVAATNRNLTQMMADKLFRADLFYRLKVFPIITPPLRDRPEDIAILARHFTKKYSRKMNKVIDKIPSETVRALLAWPWPGNVRELENFIERSVILSRGPQLRAPLAEIRPGKADVAAHDTLAQVEREHILHVLRQTHGVVTVAASRLGMPRTTLNALMRKRGISRKDL
jgi:PAS domain S-box-containing protein